jgi:pilus assembly protein CpaF
LRHAILSTIAAPGRCLSLRKSAMRKFSLEDMILMGTISVDADSILRRMVSAKLAFLISGGTGSGKTSQPLRHY